MKPARRFPITATPGAGTHIGTARRLRGGVRAGVSHWVNGLGVRTEGDAGSVSVFVR